MNKIITAFVVTILASISFGQEESTGHSYCVKFAPIQLIAGEFNFTYEQRLGKFTSLELELGQPFLKLVLQEEITLYGEREAQKVELDFMER